MCGRHPRCTLQPPPTQEVVGGRAPTERTHDKSRSGPTESEGRRERGQTNAFSSEADVATRLYRDGALTTASALISDPDISDAVVALSCTAVANMFDCPSSPHLCIDNTSPQPPPPPTPGAPSTTSFVSNASRSSSFGLSFTFVKASITMPALVLQPPQSKWFLLTATPASKPVILAGCPFYRRSLATLVMPWRSSLSWPSGTLRSVM